MTWKAVDNFPYFGELCFKFQLVNKKPVFIIITPLWIFGRLPNQMVEF